MTFDGSRQGGPWKILPDATLATEVSRGTSLVYPPWTRTTVFPKSVLMPTTIWFGWKSTNTCRNSKLVPARLDITIWCILASQRYQEFCCKGWTTCMNGLMSKMVEYTGADRRTGVLNTALLSLIHHFAAFVGRILDEMIPSLTTVPLPHLPTFPPWTARTISKIRHPSNRLVSERSWRGRSSCRDVNFIPSTFG